MRTRLRWPILVTTLLLVVTACGEDSAGLVCGHDRVGGGVQNEYRYPCRHRGSHADPNRAITPRDLPLTQ